MANIESIVQQLTQERNRIDQAIRTLTSLDSNRKTKSGKRMNAAARARISAAQKARWARVNQTKWPTQARRKSRISPAGLARIRVAAKARWAKVKAQQKKA